MSEQHDEQEQIDRDSLGAPLAIVPLGSKSLAWVSFAIAFAVILLIFNGDFKRKVTLTGSVNSTAGQFNVFPFKGGYVTQSWVQEQSNVKRGDRLFEITSEQHSKNGASLSEIRTKILVNVESLQKEMTRLKDIFQGDYRELTEQAEFLKQQQQELDLQITLQQDVSDTLEALIEGQRELVDKQYISATQMQTKEKEFSQALSDLSELKYTKLAIQKEKRSVAEQISSLKLKYENNVARIEREISTYQQKLFEVEIENETIVVAPQSGVVTALSIQSGENVKPDTLAMVIIPNDVEWNVEVYATSKDVGFVRRGNPVKLQYDAYPYQRFGLYSGTVKNVSKAAVIGSVLDSRLPPTEYFYKVTVTLDKQCILAYGKCEPLQAGMGVTANIETGRRTLVEWALDPLYTISGKL